MRREMKARLLHDEIRRRAQIGRERPRVLHRNARYHFDRRIRRQRRSERRRALLKELVREDASHLVLPGFGQKVVYVAVEVGGGLVHDEERRATLMFRYGGPLKDGLEDP